ncbi:ribonuclease H family protein [Pullulanibacillus sp. KACC 23026]|uniref:ribonuclease H family protein n=1 Tax=Pullulanibacillus sp. KACC 23026 TaxID=3028315 RepID=UPI0023B00C4A|nr:ribonuclease H family protein [Pullulanibacillus sp. KACC 23026]WEG12346.1 ribonuclease H family protein [Pullulanibacillus sp. KACC 23026]
MDVRLEFTYKTPRGLETLMTSKEMRAEKALLMVEDMERTGRVKSLQIIDGNDSTWTVKELKKYLKGVETEPHDVTVYFDGGYDVQTRKSGLGFAVYFQQNGKHYRLRKNAWVEELESNNEAEYAALHFALKELEGLGVHHLTLKIKGDSQVVISQLSGDWPVTEDTLNRWADRVEAQLDKLGLKPVYEHVTRKSNQEADQLASQALKGIEISGTIELDPTN